MQNHRTNRLFTPRRDFKIFHCPRTSINQFRWLQRTSWMYRGSQFTRFRHADENSPWSPMDLPHRANRFIGLCKLARYLEKGIWFSVRSLILWSCRRNEQRARLWTAPIGRVLSCESAINMAVTSRGARPYATWWGKWRRRRRDGWLVFLYSYSVTLAGAQSTNVHSHVWYGMNDKKRVDIDIFVIKCWIILHHIKICSFLGEIVSRSPSYSSFFSHLNTPISNSSNLKAQSVEVKLIEAQDDATSA